MEGKYDPKEAEPRLQKFWDKSNTYKFNKDSLKQFYSIDTPPPTVSGKMHLGHAFSYTQQDFIARYKRMKGFEVFYPFGTDDNGLPTQMLIEKTKKVRAKDLGRKKFTKLCIDTLKNELRPKYIEDWKRIGMSCDWNLFYTTIDNHSQKISQWSFLDLVRKKRAYRSYAPAMICPKCKTSIAQVELEDKQRTSTLHYVQIDVDGDKLVFATTRPELMMACIAVSVHPDDKRYRKYVGKTAKIPAGPEVPIIADDLTKMEFGTGVVYWCPFGDATDMEFVAKHPELEVKHIMNSDGRLNDQAGKYAGMKSEEARKAVIEDWEKLHAIVKQEEKEQIVNAHERCGTPIEFIAINQWSIKMLDLKEKWLENGEALNWFPQHMKNRYDNWAQGLKWDWNISRQIFFGIPFPVWYCKECDTPIMAEESQLPVDPLKDKPPVDKCKCGSTEFIPEDDIINTWATSSLTPQLAVKLVDKETQKKLYPMSLRPQAHDIISFWLFNTVVKAQLHYNSLPWNDVMISGWALDPKGKKMSKSKGNVIEPQVMIEKYSSDALRFWAAGCKLGDDLPFQEKDLVTGKKMVNKLWNASKFTISHLKDYKQPDKLEVFDRWILSKLQKLINDCTESFDKYEYNKPKLDLEKFFWHTFCDNYLEIVKDRIYNEDRWVEKHARPSAQHGLHTTLLAVLKMSAPILPHITEEIYQSHFAKIEDKKSIHNADWPVDNKDLIDTGAEEIGDLGIDIIQTVRKIKSENQMALNKEVDMLIVKGCDKEHIKSIEDDLKAVCKASSIKFEGKTTHESSLYKAKIGVK